VVQLRDGVVVKLLSSFVCFSFVYVWHGIQPHVLVWSVLNNTGIVLENVARLVEASRTYSRLEVRHFLIERIFFQIHSTNN
jgi:hypothetical protein